MFSGPDLLIKGNSTHDLCHPLIHLAYAYEIQSKEIATGALTLAAIHHESFTHRFPDKGAPSSRDPSKAARSPFGVLSRIRSDGRLDSFTKTPGRERLEPFLANYESVIQEYWRDSWPTTNPTEQFREALDASVALLVGTKKPEQSFGFIILHVLTACHAVRVILPELSAE